MNIPAHLTPIRHSPLPIKEISYKTPAGFPSPAQDLTVNRIDLNDILIQHPEATYFMQVKGNSMTGAGIMTAIAFTAPASGFSILRSRANHLSSCKTTMVAPFHGLMKPKPWALPWAPPGFKLNISNRAG